MIPSGSAFLQQNFKIRKQPDHTYKMNLEDNHIRSYVDEKEAVVQAIHKILSTERYQYIIYSWDYGIETLDLYGEPVSYVCPELECRITEALMRDDRITGVDNFRFGILKKGEIDVTFTVHTIYGDVESEKAVNF